MRSHRCRGLGLRMCRCRWRTCQRAAQAPANLLDPPCTGRGLAKFPEEEVRKGRSYGACRRKAGSYRRASASSARLPTCPSHTARASQNLAAAAQSQNNCCSVSYGVRNRTSGARCKGSDGAEGLGDSATHLRRSCETRVEHQAQLPSGHGLLLLLILRGCHGSHRPRADGVC